MGIWIAALVFTITRLSWILFFPVAQQSDYLQYHRMAQDLTLLNDACAGKPLGYSVFLHWVYGIFGANPAVGQAFNIVLAVATLLVLYEIGIQIGGKRHGLLIVAGFILWPTQLAHTSLLASEHLSLLLVCLIALIAIKKSTSLLSVITVGVLCGLIFEIRAIQVVALPAFLIVSSWRFKRIAICLTVFILTILFYRAGMQVVYNSHADTSALPFSLLIGTDTSSDGTYNSQVLRDYAQNCSGVDAVKEAVNNVIENPVGFAKLVFQKTIFMWSAETYGVSYYEFSKQYESIFYVFSQAYYFALLAATVRSLYRLFSNSQATAAFPLSAILLTILAHIPLEVAQRYHYSAVPMMLILIAITLNTHKLYTTPENINDPFLQ